MMASISFLAPWSAMVAAAIIPPLVLLYFLKLKRKELPISTTLLWKRAVEDLQVNSPFQRLRSNLLLFLQLLLIALAVLALTEPLWNYTETREKKRILLVDQSASMSTIEADGRSRLEKAKDEARRVVETMGRDDQIMVIAFADRARPVASFTNDKGLLKRQIAEIAPTDHATRLRDALTLAESYSTPVGENVGTSINPVEPAQLMLFSDGDIQDAREAILRRGVIEYVPIGETNDNIGIVNMDVRRNYERPDAVTIIARVRNMSSQPISRDVSLLIDGDLKQVREVRDLAGTAAAVPPPEAETASRPSVMPTDDNEIIVTFEQTHPTAGQIEVRLSGKDALPTDDRAFATIEAPHPVSALLVTHGNHFLKTALAALAPRQSGRSAEPDILTPEQYEKAREEDLVAEGRSRYDVVVFDACSTDRLPPGSYLFFGGVPKADDIAVTGFAEREVFVDWDDTHPVLRHVPMGPIHVLRWNKLTLPSETVPIIQSAEGTVLAHLARDRRQYLICAFSLFDDSRSHLNTNWVMNEGFPVFMYNALQFLTGNVAPGGNRSVRPGEAVEIPTKAGTKSLKVHRPDSRDDTIPVRDSGIAYYADTSRVGFYKPENGLQSDNTFAVNLFNDGESDIRPNLQLKLGTDTVANAANAGRTNRPVWPWLVLAAFGVLMLEWIVYTKRVWV